MKTEKQPTLFMEIDWNLTIKIMNKIILLLVTFFLLSCSNKNKIQKPAKLIEKESMEKIYYDLALLQALKTSAPEKMFPNKINPQTYIYQKYKIDSLQFVQNNNYYAEDIEEYKAMFDRVTVKLKLQKAEIDTIVNREIRLKSKKIADSLKKIQKVLKK